MISWLGVSLELMRVLHITTLFQGIVWSSNVGKVCSWPVFAMITVAATQILPIYHWQWLIECNVHRVDDWIVGFILQNQWSWDYGGTLRSYDIVHVSRIHCSPGTNPIHSNICTIVHNRPTFSLTNNAKTVIWLMSPEMSQKTASRRQGDAAPFNTRKWRYNLKHKLQRSHQMPPCLLLYFAHSTFSLLKLTMATVAAAVRERFVGGRQSSLSSSSIKHL